jgi:FtsP/CotA-like multicopper oxidase with cupredoxin domain
MLSTRKAALAAGICAVSMLAPASASAQQVESEHYSYTESFLLPADVCGDAVDFPVLDTTTYEGFYHAVQRGDGLVYEADHVRLYSTDTNTLNGKTLTFIQVNRGGTQSFVDNGDGTSTMTFKNVGMLHVYGPDGSRIGKYAGQVRGEVLLDNGGTPNDPTDDEFLEFLGYTETRNLNTLGEDWFCPLLATYLS